MHYIWFPSLLLGIVEHISCWRYEFLSRVANGDLR